MSFSGLISLLIFIESIISLMVSIHTVRLLEEDLRMKSYLTCTAVKENDDRNALTK